MCRLRMGRGLGELRRGVALGLYGWRILDLGILMERPGCAWTGTWVLAAKMGNARLGLREMKGRGMGFAGGCLGEGELGVMSHDGDAGAVAIASG